MISDDDAARVANAGAEIELFVRQRAPVVREAVTILSVILAGCFHNSEAGIESACNVMRGAFKFAKKLEENAARRGYYVGNMEGPHTIN